MKYWEERKSICDTCEYNREWYCKKCGCILPIKVKIKSAYCPIGKWREKND